MDPWTIFLLCCFGVMGGGLAWIGFLTLKLERLRAELRLAMLEANDE